MKPFWPLAANSWGPHERAAAHAVIDGEQQTMGVKVREFETAFAWHVGSRHAVMTNSGSSANLLAVAALQHSVDRDPWYNDPGSVMVPAIAWPTTYSPFQQYGFNLIVCDVDPQTLNVDMDQINNAEYSGSDIKMVVGASILGTPAPLVELQNYCVKHRLLFMEDNCESLGAKIGDKHCGTFGDVGTFSFFFSHHLNTTEGGMLVTDNQELYELAVCLRAHGWARDLPPNSPLRPVAEAGDPSGAYQFILPGYNVRPTELAAAVGLVQLKRLVSFELDRRVNCFEFQALFADDERWTIQRLDGHAVPFGFTLVFRTRTERGRASRAMEGAGIEHRLITGGSFARHPAAAHYDWRYATPGGTPHADHAHDCGLFVGNHATDLTEQIRTLHAILDKEIK